MAGKSEWRSLSRAMRSGRRYHEPTGWGALAGWCWRHMPEFLVLVVFAAVWRRLAGLGGPWLASLLLAALLAGALVWAPSRRLLGVVAGWRLTRHRLRAGLTEARVTTPSGRLPSYLCAWPTAVGERVWLWCSPGISAEDMEDETERLRAACIAREVRVTRDPRWSALVVVDVIRRDTLSAQRLIPAPLTQHIHRGQTARPEAGTNGMEPSKNGVKEEVKTSER